MSTGSPRARHRESIDAGARYDVLVLGSGVAGLATAIHAARSGLKVAVVTKSELGQSATRYAQGGIAAALEDADSPELHCSDTFAAGGVLCDPEAVAVLVGEGPTRLRELMEMGAVFDRAGDEPDSKLAFAKEGGHSFARVVHAGGDATGAEIGRALVAALPSLGVDVLEGWFALDLVVQHGRCAGILALTPDDQLAQLDADHVVLASGGLGQLFAVTTNPPESTGDGIAMALRAGVAVADLEFVQFHPTALHREVMPRPLLSEALRGEGALIRDDRGVAFMASEHPLADLAPRDVVALSIALRMAERDVDHLWLDATAIEGFQDRFPTIWRSCSEIGLDPRRDWLPVAPAAHYLCGGVLTDLDGASSLPRLWACGEVACSGVNGANRLASNSLLEGLVFGHRVVDAIKRGKEEPEFSGAMRTLLREESFGGNATERPLGVGRVRTPPTLGSSVGAADLRAKVQAVMTRRVGVLRDEVGLAEARSVLDDAAGCTIDSGIVGADRINEELKNLLVVGRAVVDAARMREESRGSHTRRDFPSSNADFVGRIVCHGSSVPVLSSLAEPAGSVPGMKR